MTVVDEGVVPLLAERAGEEGPLGGRVPPLRVRPLLDALQGSGEFCGWVHNFMVGGDAKAVFIYAASAGRRGARAGEQVLGSAGWSLHSLAGSD